MLQNRDMQVSTNNGLCIFSNGVLQPLMALNTRFQHMGACYGIGISAGEVCFGA